MQAFRPVILCSFEKCSNLSHSVNRSALKRSIKLRRFVVPIRRYCTADERSDGVIRSPFQDIEIPVRPLTEYVFQNSESFPGRPALIHSETGEVRTYADIKDVIWRTASGLARHGFQCKDVMMMLSSNTPELVIMCHAVVLLGGAVTITDNLSQPFEVKKQLLETGAKFMFTDQTSITTAMASSMMTGGQVKKLIIDGQASKMVPLNDLMNDDGSAFPTHVEFDPLSDVALLPYAAGITGVPKTATLTHFNILSNIHQLRQPDILPTDEGVTQIGLLPFFQSMSVFVNMFLALALGQTCIITSNPNRDNFLDIIEKYKVSLLFAEPSALHDLVQSPSLSQRASCLRRVLIGGAPASQNNLELIQDRLPRAAVGQVYGMTESSAFLTVMPSSSSSSKLSSAGVLLPNTQAKVMNVVDGTLCSVGESGELWVKGPQVMNGFYDATERLSCDTNGWYKTGDFAYFCKRGYLYITDRVHEVVKFKGHQVSAVELEDVLKTHPGVLDAAVTGIPDEQCGELPKAYVVLNTDIPTTAAQLADYVAKKVSSYKRLHGGVETVTQLPRTSDGRLSRQDLRDL